MCSDRDNVLMMVLISTMIIMMKVISLTSIMQPYITCHTPTLHCVSCIQIFSNLGRLVLVYQTSCQHHSQWALTSHSRDAACSGRRSNVKTLFTFLLSTLFHNSLSHDCHCNIAKPRSILKFAEYHFICLCARCYYSERACVHIL